MKVRCPFCREVFVAEGRHRCSQCGRTVLLPGFFGSTPAGDVRSIAAGARARARRRQIPAGIPFLGRPGRLVLILIVMLAAGIALVRRVHVEPPSTLPHQRKVARRNLATLGFALERLCRDCGRYPSTREGLVSLVHDPGLAGWIGPYVFELKPDPWGRSFQYRSEGRHIVLFSIGPDGEEGSPDDLVLPGHDATRRPDGEAVFQVDLDPARP